MRRSSAMLLAAAALLAGIFLGWQGAMLRFDSGGASPAAQMPPAAPDNSTALMAQAKTLEQKAAQNPNNAAIWAQLGNTYFDAGFAERAVTAYQKSLAINPGQPDVLTDMGVMLRDGRKFREALGAFQQAAQLDPKHEQSRLNMGVVLLHDLNDKAGALKAWRELLAINPQAQTPDGKSLADEVKLLQAQ